LGIADVQPTALAPGWGNCPREDFDIWRQICRIVLWIIIELNNHIFPYKKPRDGSGRIGWRIAQIAVENDVAGLLQLQLLI
jgi:hypothetical protein